MAIIRPSFIALDSSHLAAIADDWSCLNPTRTATAKEFLAALNASDKILLVAAEHLFEVLRHHDHITAAHRISFLKSLQGISWISSFKHSQVAGSVVDILTHEAQIAFEKPHANSHEIRNAVRTTIFKTGSGAQLVANILDCWDEFQCELWRQEKREREIVAISRSTFIDISKMKVADWLNGRLRSSEDASRQLVELQQRLSTDIETRGDRRISDPDKVSKRFFEEVALQAATTISDTEAPALQILHSAGLDSKDISNARFMGELFDLATFRKKLEIVNRNLNLPFQELKSRVSEDRLPSGVVQKEMRLYSHDPPERKGSDLIDSHLVCLAPYADLTYVDKRTHENVRQCLKKSHEFSRLVRQIRKAKDYRLIASSLST